MKFSWSGLAMRSAYRVSLATACSPNRQGLRASGGHLGCVVHLIAHRLVVLGVPLRRTGTIPAKPPACLTSHSHAA